MADWRCARAFGTKHALRPGHSVPCRRLENRDSQSDRSHSRPGPGPATRFIVERLGYAAAWPAHHRPAHRPAGNRAGGRMGDRSQRSDLRRDLHCVHGHAGSGRGRVLPITPRHRRAALPGSRRRPGPLDVWRNEPFVWWLAFFARQLEDMAAATVDSPFDDMDSASDSSAAVDEPSRAHRRTLKLTLAYDGTLFHGWQRQAGVRTVQEEVQNAVATLLREPVNL